MARTIASLPVGSRITDSISLGVITKCFPPQKVREVLNETRRASVRERDLTHGPATELAAPDHERWEDGVSRQGHIVQPVRDRPRLKDSGLVAGEAPWCESEAAIPSDNMLGKECAQRTRSQRAVNAGVARCAFFSC
jgi:hypothetical protein